MTSRGLEQRPAQHVPPGWNRSTGSLHIEVEQVARNGQPCALAVFDLLDEWINHNGFECRSALEALGDGRGHTPTLCAVTPARGSLGVSKERLESYAAHAGATNPREAGYQLHALMMGAVLSAGCGHSGAAKDARSVAKLMLKGS